jgi:hypothetical protein
LADGDIIRVSRTLGCRQQRPKRGCVGAVRQRLEMLGDGGGHLAGVPAEHRKSLVRHGLFARWPFRVQAGGQPCLVGVEGDNKNPQVQQPSDSDLSGGVFNSHFLGRSPDEGSGYLSSQLGRF